MTVATLAAPVGFMIATVRLRIGAMTWGLVAGTDRGCCRWPGRRERRPALATTVTASEGAALFAAVPPVIGHVRTSDAPGRDGQAGCHAFRRPDEARVAGPAPYTPSVRTAAGAGTTPFTAEEARAGWVDTPIWVKNGASTAICVSTRAPQ